MGDKLYPEERLIKISEIVRKDMKVDVDQLARYFNVTSATIRADLRELENRGIIIRTHGGAILKDIIDENLKPEKDLSYNKRLQENIHLKEAIGKACASLINDGDSIMMDDGSTTLQVARYLPDINVTIVTNGLNICLELVEHPNIDVIATGGMLNKIDLSYHGKVAEETAARFHANKAILGASGLSIKHGLTSPDEQKAELKKVMIANSDELIVVADNTKLMKVSFIQVCPLDRINTIVTDSQAPDNVINLFKKNGVNIIIAE